MALPMIRPTKHPKTHVYRLRLAIPSHLRETTARLYGRRAEFIENLGTKNPSEAKRRAPDAERRLRNLMVAAVADHAGTTAELTDKQVAALAGEWYRDMMAERADDVGTAAQWSMSRSELWDQVDRDDSYPEGRWSVSLSKADRRDATALLTHRGLPPDPAAIERVGRAVFDAKMLLAELMEKRAGGDWSPDPHAKRFPAVAASAPGPSLTMDALLAGWAADQGWQMDAKPISRPLYDRKRTMARLAAFLDHTDAGGVTQADAVRWKEEMQRRGLHASTVRNDLSEMSAVWKWGLRNGKLSGTVNPFAGVSPPKAKKKRRNPRAFTDEEAARVLQAAREAKGAYRWLPWVACLTGARVSEICQADRGDVAFVDGVAVIRIHDEGDDRSLKTDDSRRTIPIHPALISEGFLRYVNSLPDGSPLFPDVPPDKTFGRRGVTASKRMARWIRALGISDPRISPNHSWRHWFIGACRSVSMQLEVRSRRIA